MESHSPIQSTTSQQGFLYPSSSTISAKSHSVETHHCSEVRPPYKSSENIILQRHLTMTYFTTPALGCKPYGIYYTHTNYSSITSEGNSKFLMQPVMHMF